MPPLSELFGDRLLLRNAIATVLLLVVVLVVRGLALRWVRRAAWTSDQIQLKWTVQVRWASLLILFLGVILVWAAELRTLALSFVALGAAIVLATKELILCISGSALRASSGAFSIGDRIEIDGIRGDVVDVGLFTTTILETGPVHRRTGRAIVLPNSLLLSKALINETFTEDFVLHIITVPVRLKDEDWHDTEHRLLEAAREVCSPFLEEARRQMRVSAHRHGLPDFSVEPTVSLRLPDAENAHLVLRVPSPAREKGQTEQQILRRFMSTAVDPG